MTPAGILVLGAGRMGTSILQAAGEDERVAVRGVVVRESPPSGLPGSPPVFTSLDSAVSEHPGTVVLDFSAPEGAAERAGIISRAGLGLVQGTTGLDDAARAGLESAASRVPVVQAPNTSPGMTLFKQGLLAVLDGMSPAWQIDLLDRHHRGKKDAPSGTARMLASVIQGAGRDTFHVSSEREGDVIGEHTVRLTGRDEEIVLTHRALDRGLFARGALLAARFAAQSGPGLYRMEDVLRWSARLTSGGA